MLSPQVEQSRALKPKSSNELVIELVIEIIGALSRAPQPNSGALNGGDNVV
jgi:hypothetical protein